MRINFGWFILGDDMVAFVEQYQNRAECGKSGKLAHPVSSSASSDSSVVQQSVNPVVTSCGENHLLLPDTPIPRRRDLGTCLDVDRCSLLVERRADGYGNTIVFTAPGADGVWFTDDDTQSSYGVNEIIYCGYRFDPEAELYYVRNRSYNTVLGRWIQRDPIGYRQSANLYVMCGNSPTIFLDPAGTTSKSCTSTSYDARLTPPLWLPVAFGFSVNFNGEIRVHVGVKWCPHCCSNGSQGERYTVGAQISGDVTGTAYLGLYIHPTWADVDIFAGLSGTVEVKLAGSVSQTWDTCRGAPGKLYFCVGETISAELRGGAEAAIHLGWFDLDVGVEVWISGRFTDRVCFACDAGGCEVAKVTLGAWSAEIGAKACFWGVCASWTQEFS